MAKQYGIPEKLRLGKRPYTLTPEAREARKKNAQKSTGPNSEEGKKAASRNSWRHGLYARTFILGSLGRPCQRKCEKFPCDLVNDSLVKPGETCLDKLFVAEAFDKILDAVENKKYEGFNQLAILELAGALQVLRNMKEVILEEGVVIKSEKMDKDGNHIGDEYKPHPALAIYSKMLVDLGMTPQELLITPKEVKRAEKGIDPEALEDASTLMSKAIMNLAGMGKAKTK